MKNKIIHKLITIVMPFLMVSSISACSSIDRHNHDYGEYEKIVQQRIQEIIKRGKDTFREVNQVPFNNADVIITYGFSPVNRIPYKEMTDVLDELYESTYEITQDDIDNNTEKYSKYMKGGFVFYKGGYYYRAPVASFRSYENFYYRPNFLYFEYSWYEMEPIDWQILERDGNTYTLISKTSLDRRLYSTLPTLEVSNTNKYETSDIRKYLNSDFIDMAFYLNDEYLQTTVVDNSPESAGYPTGTYEYENTNDKVYLPSVTELEKYGLLEDKYRSPKPLMTEPMPCPWDDRFAFPDSKCCWTRSPDYKSEPNEKNIKVKVSSIGSYETDRDTLDVRPMITLKLPE